MNSMNCRLKTARLELNDESAISQSDICMVQLDKSDEVLCMGKNDLRKLVHDSRSSLIMSHNL